MDLIKALNNEQLKENVPVINIGDTVRVSNKIKEGTRERVQLFEGTVIAKNGGGISETFTVRRVSYGVGVEKTFPVHSPNVEKVEIVRNGKVRRAKLYYLRDRVGKSSKVKEPLECFGCVIRTRDGFLSGLSPEGFFVYPDKKENARPPYRTRVIYVSNKRP